jgi:hypothetical protein
MNASEARTLANKNDRSVVELSEILNSIKHFAERGEYEFTWSGPIYIKTKKVLKTLGYSVDTSDTEKTVVSWE